MIVDSHGIYGNTNIRYSESFCKKNGICSFTQPEMPAVGAGALRGLFTQRRQEKQALVFTELAVQPGKQMSIQLSLLVPGSTEGSPEGVA
jgi:hypothetical protein